MKMLVRAPVAIEIPDVPESVDSIASILAYGPARFAKILQDAGIKFEIDTDRASCFFTKDDVKLALTHEGADLESRVSRVETQPDGAYALEFSTDRGATFERVALLVDAGLAQKLGAAWMEGYTESGL